MIERFWLGLEGKSEMESTKEFLAMLFKVAEDLKQKKHGKCGRKLKNYEKRIQFRLRLNFNLSKDQARSL